MYDKLVEVRHKDIQGETDWHWVKSDVGAFSSTEDGPMRDWIDGHSTKYFQYLSNFDTVVTGGTSCGMHVRFYGKMFRHVYAFEPDPLSFHCMVNNAQYDHVYKLNAAIGPKNGIVGISRVRIEGNDCNIGMHKVSSAVNEFHTPMLAIDSLHLLACDLIQLDVEGFERGALQGAENTIRKFKPLVIAERFDDPKARNFMKNTFGYELVDVSFLDSIYMHIG
jgi:FkbM family methyltransferase